MSRIFDDLVRVYFAIESVELSASELTNRLEMQPDRQRAIGDPRGKTGKRWESHGWEIKTMVVSADYGEKSASELIPIALQKFEDRADQLTKGVPLLGGSAQKHTVIEIFAEYIPGIELTHSFSQLISRLDCTLQVDLNVEKPSVSRQ